MRLKPSEYYFSDAKQRESKSSRVGCGVTGGKKVFTFRRGHSIVRLVYLDEAGISNEPSIVVAGVIVDPDRQAIALEKYLHDLAENVWRGTVPEGFVFHATDLFHGSGWFPRRDWDQPTRWGILDKLVSIPREFDLPISIGPVNREGFLSRYPEPGVKKVVLNAKMHAVAYSVAMIVVERWMHQKAGKNEIALMFAEDNSDARRDIKEVHKLWRDPQRVAALNVPQHIAKGPLRKILQTANFASKQEASLLQIADVCAFTIRRKMSNSWKAESFFRPLISQLIVEPDPAL